MKKILTDVHTHSTFSADGKSPLSDMLATAYGKGLGIYGISEHFDYDYLVNGIPFYGGEAATYTDPDAYFPAARALQAEYAGRMEVLVGGEFGYADNPKAWGLYAALAEKYRPDFVVNSVHSDGRYDFSDEQKRPYLREDGSLRPKKEAYGEYFALVRRSLDAPYPYDIVGHMTYCTRYAPYADKRADWASFRGEIDGILCGVIARHKILEVNSSSYGAPGDFLPDQDILRRYYALGGREVSFASDAHLTWRVAEKREKVVKALRQIGFAFLTVPKAGVHLRVEI
ncbi:MAG TPA: histidinol-phosphatase HisJ family protein [Candidatus Scatosoma pullicola]|nr:histidinol-phosphatase HisJ family protein [Candidatus Scatosoma pullicola]